MKLRDHPLMTRKSGVKTWPPLWINTSKDPRDRPRGEIGILTRVLRNESIENTLFVWVDYEGSTYVGAMNFDDTAFCHELRRVLELSLGLSMQEIGELDFSYTL
jgi:hypothetical protein